eukprot:CAMPEP_0201590028 /NCGR_PEP_ID=MMETSP0190_2-20130828/173414_1 /ASSEMBLY_ACC=CAM_ASM_000263 /TAXON_ID=37353 /ORGANISM="Rosalina sp." /LENGTH=161 /DNA_ID=CAMNT_0048045345 /DNA_START=76 /DNA_END=558 /DNA_ORIENTATION=-
MKTISQTEKHQNQSRSANNNPGNDRHEGMDEDDTSKLGLGSTDSLKLQPGASNNYKFIPSGPTLVVIDPNTIPHLNGEQVHESPEHGYNGQIEVTKRKESDTHSELELTILSIQHDNKMNPLELNKSMESIRSDNSEALYRNHGNSYHHNQTTGHGYNTTI